MINFNNIPTTIRTPGAYTEVNNARALQGLVQNPHKAIILGQKELTGTATKELVYAISNESVADGYFGTGSPAARMCRAFKLNNPNTDLYCMALSETGTILASGKMSFAGSCTKTGTLFLMVNGVNVTVTTTSAWSAVDVASAVQSAIMANPQIGIIASLVTSTVLLKAVGSGLIGNYYDVRTNYYDGQSDPPGLSVAITALAGGTGQPNIAGAWAVIGTQQFQHIIQPYTDTTTLTSLEGELANRFLPLINMQGFGYTAVRSTLASATTLGLTRNSPHNCILALDNSPTGPEIMAAALGGVCAGALNQNPGRPLHGLTLQGVLPPPLVNRRIRSERDTCLYSGISTYTVDQGGNVNIERIISTYQTNAFGAPDPSYLDINTLFTLMEIRFQYNTRMLNKFIAPRFSLAADTFTLQPGQMVATPKTIKQEIICLFNYLEDVGLIQNANECVANLVVQLDTTDTSRVNVLLPPQLIRQFRVLAGSLQYIL